MIKQYDCDLYPFCLWVGDEIKGINKKFEFYNNISDIHNIDISPLELDDTNLSHVGLTQLVVEKKSRYKGALVLLNKKALRNELKLNKGTVYNTIAHEAKHVADLISEMKGIAEALDWHTNEHQAYLIGWIAEKIGEYWESIKNKK